LIAAPAMAATPQDLNDCNTKFGQEAVLACTRVIEDKSSTSEALDQAFFNRALSYETIGLIPEAMSDANESVRRQPNEAGGYTIRGRIYQDQQDFERSLADFNEAIRLDFKSSLTYAWRGLSYFYMRDSAHAIEDFDAALRIDPKYKEAYWDRGQAHEVADDPKAAIADYGKLIELEPKSLRGYIRRAVVFIRLGDAAHAIEDASAAMRIEPANAAALGVRADAYVAKGDFERAIDDYSAAIHFGREYVLYVQRGIAYRLKGDREHAIDDFYKAINQRPLASDDARTELKKLGVEVPANREAVPPGKTLLDVLKFATRLLVVMAGLVPAISLRKAMPCVPERDRQVKPGDDKSEFAR